MFLDVKYFENLSIFMRRGLYKIGDDVYYVDESYFDSRNEDLKISTEVSNAIRLKDAQFGVLKIKRNVDKDIETIVSFEFIEDGIEESERYQMEMFEDMLSFLEEDETFQFEFGKDFIKIVKEYGILNELPFAYQEDGSVVLEYAGCLNRVYDLSISNYDYLVAKPIICLNGKKVLEEEVINFTNIIVDNVDEDLFILDNDWTDLIYNAVTS